MASKPTNPTTLAIRRDTLPIAPVSPWVHKPRVLHPLLLLPALLMVCLAVYAKEEHTIDWNDSELTWYGYREGLVHLKANETKGLVIVYADWCPTCQQYAKLFRDDSVIQSLQGITLIRVNKDREPDVSSLFNIDGDYIPRTFALDQKGEIIRDLDADNPKYWYYLPANDPEPLKTFVSQLKQY